MAWKWRVSFDSLQERTVTIRRQTIGGFGLSIKVIAQFLTAFTHIFCKTLKVFVLSFFHRVVLNTRSLLWYLKYQKNRRVSCLFSLPPFVLKNNKLFIAFYFCFFFCLQLSFPDFCLSGMEFSRFVQIHKCALKILSMLRTL